MPTSVKRKMYRLKEDVLWLLSKQKSLINHSHFSNLLMPHRPGMWGFPSKHNVGGNICIGQEFTTGMTDRHKGDDADRGRCANTVPKKKKRELRQRTAAHSHFRLVGQTKKMNEVICSFHYNTLSKMEPWTENPVYYLEIPVWICTSHVCMTISKGSKMISGVSVNMSVMSSNTKERMWQERSRLRFMEEGFYLA